MLQFRAVWHKKKKNLWISYFSVSNLKRQDWRNIHRFKDSWIHQTVTCERHEILMRIAKWARNKGENTNTMDCRVTAVHSFRRSSQLSSSYIGVILHLSLQCRSPKTRSHEVTALHLLETPSYATASSWSRGRKITKLQIGPSSPCAPVWQIVPRMGASL